MKFGYARISTPKQSLENQIALLKDNGCEEIFSDTVSGFNSQKIQFERLMEFLRKGDILTVTGIDRLGRSTKDLALLLEELQVRGVNLAIVGYPDMDTNTASGKMIFNFMAMVAENERMRNIERIHQGIEGARKRGKKIGRPNKLQPDRINKMVAMYNSKSLSVTELCLLFAISKPTFYHYVNKGK